MKRQLHVYVFSYNRGVFLDNALQSIHQCLPHCPVTLIDDNSSDEKTLSILEKWRDAYDILNVDNDYQGGNTLGGLYNNMRYAFSDAKKKGARYVLFIQDDMQLTRPVMPDDYDHFDAFFANNSNSAQLQPCFLKKYLSALDKEYLYLDESGHAYLRPSHFPGYSGFSDVGLFDLERFYSLFEDVRDGEYVNNEYAQKNNIQFGIYTIPFMMWLPYPISNRGRERNIPLQTVEFIGGCGYYPYEIMSASEIESLSQCDLNRRSYAETWLKPRNLNNADTWCFAGGIPNLLARGGFRAVLGKLLTRIKKLLRA